MEEFLNLNNIELSTTSLAQFLIGFIITIILSISLKHIYVKYSNSVSNKKIISNIFPLFGVSIFLIVITIKSSIVLSLGLVGALSIIRFRTAIKEAEQIVYFLIITGIAIATAANSYVYPFVLVIFVFVYNFFMTYNKDTGVHSVNDQLILNIGNFKGGRGGLGVTGFNYERLFLCEFLTLGYGILLLQNANKLIFPNQQKHKKPTNSDSGKFKYFA